MASCGAISLTRTFTSQSNLTNAYANNIFARRNCSLHDAFIQQQQKYSNLEDLHSDMPTAVLLNSADTTASRSPACIYRRVWFFIKSVNPISIKTHCSVSISTFSVQNMLFVKDDAHSHTIKLFWYDARIE
ncbi:unnamed protein product [Albugo candida]|uniref:Uncharacterized protein n=1 Tax=Albugo candida TaxID=65357 RepID=A0A024GLA4_9STRA|nr:unnamed protein product [Albugo candida]|eukprot:CCI47121.1 unnamed protein product [Albugo candida]